MAVNQNQPIQTRPSLYATIRLARLVLDFRERLKSKVKIRHLVAAKFGSLEVKKFKARAYEDLDRALRSQDDFGKSVVQHRTYGQNTGSDLGFPALLNDLSFHAKPGGLPLSTIAAQDQLFLEHNIHHLTNLKSVEITHIFDVSTLLLERLHQLQGSHVGGHDDDTNFEKYNANLEHLLRCLQQAAFEALIHLSLRLVEAEALRWNHHRRRLARILDEWFAEWPNGQHPLSTTWPWNIRPSLVILWGVCWMFYAGEDGQMWMPKQMPQSSTFSENVRPRQVALPITSQHDAGNWAAPTIHTSSAPLHWPQLPAENDTRLAGRANNRNSDYQTTLPDDFVASALGFPYIFNPTASSDRLLGPLSSQPDIQGTHSSFPSSSAEYPFATDWPFISQSQTLSPGIETTGLGRQTAYSGLNVPGNRQATHFLKNTGDVSRQPGLQPPVVDMQGYPSPTRSDCSIQQRPTCPPVSPLMAKSPDLPLRASASTETSPRIRQEENRKSLEPTKNVEGKIYCAHPECADQPTIFARKCEWSKHMDKHNRPYVCEEPGCEKIQGFTYSGGLLRHQREVHRQHGGPKASCMCPYRDCKRSTGVGFSRKENLAEHLRRVHRGVGEQQQQQQDRSVLADVRFQALEQNAMVPAPLPETRKRKKALEYPDNEGGILPPEPQPQKRRRPQEPDAPQSSQRDPIAQPAQTLQQKVDALTRELHICQEKIKRLEQTVEQMARTQVQQQRHIPVS